MTKARDTADINSGTNTAAGEDALENNTGINNTAVGYQSLYANTTGSDNVAIGINALGASDTGSRNVAVGRAALGSHNPSGAQVGYNVAIGYDALTTSTTATSNTAVGGLALRVATTGNNNTAVGYGSMVATTTGDTNSAFGSQALSNNTTANNNTAVGYRASHDNTTGTRNVSMGKDAMYQTTTGSDQVGIGYEALTRNTTGANNVAIGKETLSRNTTGNHNVAVGYEAGYSNTTGTNNTVIGRDAGYSNQTADGNVFMGEYAGRNTTNSNNTFLGTSSGWQVTSGQKNTIIGRYNGNQGGLDIRTLSNRIVLSDGDGNPRHYVNASGDQAFSTVDMTTSNGSVGRVYAYEAPSNNLCNIYHLNSASHQVIFEARRNGRTNERMSQINIGENGSSQGEVTIFSSTANANLSGGVVVANGATSWSSASDTRLKTITGTYDNALQDIANIEPIKFTWKADSTNQPNVGVSAQSVQAVVPEAVDARKNLLTPDDETEYLSVKYTELIPLMIASIQELSAKNDALEARIATLEG